MARSIFGGLIALALLALTACDSGLAPSPADLVGEPIRIASPDGGDHVVTMTSQWRSYRTGNTSRGTSHTNLLVDVWGFDARTAKPVWRTRLVDERSGVNMDRQLLGAHGGIVWLLDGQQLVGLSPKDGSRVADSAALEAANPALKGLVPKEARFYRFDPKGLSFTAADGRDWRLTGQGAATKPDGPRLTSDAQRKPAEPGVVIPAHTGKGNGTSSFYARGLNIQNRQWIGLLDEAEAQAFQKNQGIGGVDPANHPRTRLWSAAMGTTQTFFGPRPTVANFRPLPESPEFLSAALLQDGRCCHNTPILLFKPDGLLVLHRDRIDAAGKLQLTRISGPLGKTVWTTTLPMEAIEAVMPGETTLALYGRSNEPRLFGRDKSPESIDRLVVVDNTTGALSAYGFRVKATAAEDLPAGSKVLAD